MVAILVVYVNRITELKKDARSRRQDALEKIVAEFELVHAAVIKLLVAIRAFSQQFASDASKAEPLKQKAQRLLEEAIDDPGKLAGLVGRLKLLRLAEASKAVERFAKLLPFFWSNCEFLMIDESVSSVETSLAESYETLQEERSHIQTILSDAYNRL